MVSDLVRHFLLFYAFGLGVRKKHNLNTDHPRPIQDLIFTGLTAFGLKHYSYRYSSSAGAIIIMITRINVLMLVHAMRMP